MKKLIVFTAGLMMMASSALAATSAAPEIKKSLIDSALKSLNVKAESVERTTVLNKDLAQVLLKNGKAITLVRDKKTNKLITREMASSDAHNEWMKKQN